MIESEVEQEAPTAQTASTAPLDWASTLDRSFYSPAEVARLAGLHPSTILHYIHSGRLYAVKLSERTYRIPNRAVLKLLAPELVRPPTFIDRPDEIVDITEADTAPEWRWPGE